MNLWKDQQNWQTLYWLRIFKLQKKEGTFYWLYRNKKVCKKIMWTTVYQKLDNLGDVDIKHKLPKLSQEEI